MVRQVDLTAPSALLRAMIEGTLSYDSYAMRRAALKLTAGIADLKLVTDLQDDLLVEMEAQQLQIWLGDQPEFLVAQFKRDAVAALQRILAAARNRTSDDRQQA